MERAPYIIKERKIRVALVGCGRISHNHFQAIQSHSEQLELTAVCDTAKEALDKATDKYGVNGYSDLTSLLNHESPDLIVLCTPSGLHPEQTILSARHGVHVLTEKPMATRFQDGLEMVRVCDEEGVRLFVVKQNRLNPTVQALKKAIEGGRFGRIYLASVNVFWTRPDEYYAQAPWRGTWELDGGAFMNQASHYVDLTSYLLGPVESVQAMTATLARKIEAEDTGLMNVRFRDGGMASISVTMLTYPKNLEGSITILGEKGTVRLGGVALNQIEHWEFSEKLPEDDAVLQDTAYLPSSVYGVGHPLYYENVVQVLRGEASPFVDGREGLRSLELLQAAYLAANENRNVPLPLEG